MALFDKEHFGKPISVELSDYLRTYTDSQDWANASIETSISTSTIRDVIYRKNSVTESNSVAIIHLMRIAIKNCEQNIVKSTEAKEELETMLS